MLISGGLGGLAAAVHLMGAEQRLLESSLGGYGYDSIAAALVGQLHPAGLLLGGLFFGALRAGSNGMQISVGIPSTLIFVIQGVIIVFVLASYLVRPNRARGRRAKPSAGPAPDSASADVDLAAEKRA
jgi:simple sugar transport system permease protein